MRPQAPSRRLRAHREQPARPRKRVRAARSRACDEYVQLARPAIRAETWTPPPAITSAMKVIDHVVPPVASLRFPKMYGPAIAAPLPTPSTSPNAVERTRVGKSSAVYG